MLEVKIVFDTFTLTEIYISILRYGYGEKKGNVFCPFLKFMKLV